MRGKGYIAKRMLAVVLSVALLVGSVDMTAWAAENAETPEQMLQTLEEGGAQGVEAATGVGNDIGNETVANSAMNADVAINGTDSLGAFLADSLTETVDNLNNPSGCHILSLEVQSKTTDQIKVFAEYECIQDCALVVGLYDETGSKLLFSGRAAVTAEQNIAVAEIESGGIPFPDYFILKGYLIENDTLRPLCNEFTCTLYTEGMQKLLALRADDPEIAGRVYNLDEKVESNFVVYREGILAVSAGDAVNQLVSADEEARVYTFKNPDTELSSVKENDIISYQMTDGLLIIKVSEVTKDAFENTITIAGTETSKEEVFDYIKIEVGVPADSGLSQYDAPYDEEITGGTSDEIPHYEIDYNEKVHIIDKKFKVLEEKMPTENSPVKVKVEGSIELKVDLVFKFYFSFLDGVLNSEVSLDYNTGFSLEASGKFSKEFKLDTISVNPPACPWLQLSLVPKFVVEVSGKLSVNLGIAGRIGTRISKTPGTDLTKDSINKFPTPKAKYEAEVEIYVAFAPEFMVGVLDTDIVNIGMEAQAGFSISAKMSSSREYGETKRHACKKCIAGDVSFKWKLSFKFEVAKWIADALDIKPVTEKKFADGKLKLLDFYYSLDQQSGDLGECPYKEYKVTYQVKDKAQKPIKGAKIVDTVNGSSTSKAEYTDEKGNCSVWLVGGWHSVKVTNDGYADRNPQPKYVDKTFVWDITLTKKTETDIETPENRTVAVKVKDKYGNPVNGAKVNLLNSKSMISTAKMTDATGMAQISVAAGFYLLSVEKDTYKKATRSFVLNNNRNIDIILASATGEDISDTDIYGNRLSLRGDTSAVIDSNGSLWMWGDNSYGILGDGTREDSYVPKKIMDGVASISIGKYHSAAVKKDGSLWMWGINVYGELGDGTTEDKYTPTKIMDDVVSVSLGERLSAAIKKDGSLWMWGWNVCGAFGDGTREDSYVPKKIMDNVIAVSLGQWTSGAIKKDGSLWMWGWNWYGKLGDGTTEDSYVSKKIMDGVASVSLGTWDSAAIKKDGSLWMWGANLRGELGDGTTEKSLVPKKIMDDVIAVNLGEIHSGAIKKDGSLWMWGNKSWGKLGDGTREDAYVPKKIMDDVVSVSLGKYHSGAIKKDGSLWMWGRNYEGELGDGTTEDSYVPKKIMDGLLPVASVSNYNTSSVVDGAETVAESELTQMDAPAAEDSDLHIALVSGGDAESISAEGLKKEEVYNLYVVKSIPEDEDILAPSNLLYIGQGTSDKDGKIAMEYQPGESCDNPIYLLVSMGKDDIAEADVTFAPLEYTGAEQYVSPVVTWHNEELAINIDYELTGDYSATDIGSYTATIKGINRFAGELAVEYQVRCLHPTKGDWEVVKAATCSAVGSRQKKCTVCGEVAETEEIAKLAHTAGDWEIVSAATATAAGKKQKKCTVCGEVVETEEIAKLNPSGEGDQAGSGDGNNGETGNGGENGGGAGEPAVQYAYRITYSLGGGENAASNPVGYDGTAAVTLAAPTRTGYKFAGWYSDAAFKKKVTEIAAGSTGNKVLYAKWTAHKYKITFKKGADGVKGSMSALKNRVYGTTYELPVNKFKRTGFIFLGWGLEENGADVAFRDCEQIKNLTAESGGSKILYARWLDIAESNAHTITYRLNGGVNDPGNPAYYTEGTAVTLKDPTRVGYKFGGWYTDAKCSSKKKVTEIDAASKKNRTLYAKWTPLTYKIVYKPNPTGITGGRSNPASGTGGNVTNTMSDTLNVKTGVKAALRPNKFKYDGYTFAGWNTEPDGSGAFYKDKVKVKDLDICEDGTYTDTVTLYAQWTETKYTITYTLNKGKWSSGTKAPKDYTISSGEIILPEPARSKYTFDGWYTTKKCKEGTKMESIPAGSTASVKLYAKWVQKK